MRLNASRFLTDTATWTHGGTVDAYGRVTSPTVETIAVRWLQEVRLVRGKDGEEVVSSAKISTLAAVKVGDLITDAEGVEREVLSAGTAQDVRGTFSHYTARLR